MVDEQVGGEKGTTLRLGDSTGRFLDGRTHTGLAHRVGQLFPQRRIAGQGDFPNFSRGDALREKAELFREGEPRRVFAFHETSGHFLKQRGRGLLRSPGQALAGEFEDDAVKTVGHDKGTAPLAARGALPLAQRGEKFPRRVPLRLGPRTAFVDPALVVRTAGEGFFPRLIPKRFKLPHRSEAIDVGRSQARQRKLRRLSEQRITQPVDCFEMTEKQNQPFPVIHRKAFVDRPERMRHGVRDALLLEVARQLVDIAPQPLDLRVLRLGETPSENMDLHIVLGEKRRDFLAEKCSGLAGDLQTSVDRVVVGERDEVEALFFQRPVKRLRRGATGRKIHFAQQPVRGPRAVTRVEMKIGSGHERRILD